MRCVRHGCGSYAINPHRSGRDGTDTDLCDVCYWRKRAEAQPELLEALQDVIGWVPGRSAWHTEEPQQAVAKARAAIAKATGAAT